jgi:FAD synthetase
MMMSSKTHKMPNWRNTNPDDSNNPPPFSHFDSSIATAAPWSAAAYQSSLDLYARFTSCTDPYIAPMLTSALHDLEMAYRLYGPYCIVGSYNGGKDACVIFHLMRAVHAKFCGDMENEQSVQKFMIPRPRVIYFQHQDEFPSVLSLLDETVEKYDAEMLAFESGTSFPKGLTYLVENNHPPGKTGQYPTQRGDGGSNTPSHPLAFILGTRSDDPNAGSQGVYAPSSHYMPPFLRVNPILKWTYGQVWHFLRIFDLDYCPLYDEGYTSLGTVKDTIPCPALKKEDGGYFPAYMLSDWSLERAGRLDKKKKDQKQKDDNEEIDVSKHQVTMSQTSSTVSLADASTQQQLMMRTGHEKSMSTVINQDDLLLTNSTIYESVIPNSPSVALIVIGDELLKGLTSDANVLSASRALRSYNVSLARVSIISDDSQTIVDEIKRIRNEVDVVITSGGVGPTHDDVTVRSVAAACGAEIELNLDMVRLLVEKMGCSDRNEQDNADESTLPEGIRKMASIPVGATLRYLSSDPKKDEWPVLQCKNIFVLPGVPNYFQNQIEQLAAYLSSPLTIAELSSRDSLPRDAPLRRLSTASPPPRSDIYRLLLSTDENSIVSELNATVHANPHVSFGSYPLVDHPEYKTIITLEGRFYNGGYTKGSERLLSRALSDCSAVTENQSKDSEKEPSRPSLYFSKHEMDSNVEKALADLKSRLPPESIIKVDTNDHLAVDQM